MVGGCDVSADNKNAVDPDENPIAAADEMLSPSSNRTLSPSADAMEGAPGRPAGEEVLDGQLGPDEISEPDEVVRNHDAKRHQ